MAANITVVGTGYVGLIAAIGLADFGNHVLGVDIDEKKIEMLKNGISPIYEPGCADYLERNLKNGHLEFTSDIGIAIQNSEVIIIAVGTPPDQDGNVDLSGVFTVAESFAQNLNAYKLLVTKSTVPVGTNKAIVSKVENICAEKKHGVDFDVVSNPEFLREGRAIQDFFHPDRIVIGTESDRAKALMEDIYRSLYLIQTPFVYCNHETAELIKYAANSFLALKITYINQIANLSEEVSADVHQVAQAMGMDGRISPKFLHPGPGYGGSCFPKDTEALVVLGNEYNIDLSLIKETIRANKQQKKRMVDKLGTMLEKAGKQGFKDTTIGVLGLAFKSETDDIRESPALSIIESLLENGAKIQAHDPQAMENGSKVWEQVVYCNSEFDAAKDADAVVICTEWNIYRNIDLARLGKVMKSKIILDTRNVLDIDNVHRHGFIYQGVGRLLR